MENWNEKAGNGAVRMGQLDLSDSHSICAKITGHSGNGSGVVKLVEIIVRGKIKKEAVARSSVLLLTRVKS
jgi:hypothetical protein